MKKIIFTLTIVVMLFVTACAKPPADADRAQINTGSEDTMPSEGVEPDNDNSDIDSIDYTIKDADLEKSSFEFEGYGPGKSHIGTFDILSGELYYDEAGNLIKLKGVIDAVSVNTGIDGLNNHLKTGDFFDVENYPKIIAKSTSIDTVNGKITGMLTFHGVTHEVTFPATFTKNSVNTDFLLDTTPFNIKYTGINKDVRIAFTMVASE